MRLQVDESNLDRAREVLDVRLPASAEGEYVDEEYRCPACHRKAVDLLPVTGRMRSTRLGCLGMLLLPIVVTVLVKLLDLGDAAGSIPPALVAVWVLALAVLGLVVLTAKRHKRCRECGHEW